MKNSRILKMLLLLLLCVNCSSVGSFASEYGDETHTVIFYMIGSNLESEFGLMSDVIKDLESVHTGDELNLILYASGASRWKDDNIDVFNDFWQIKDGQKKLLRTTKRDHEYALNPDTMTQLLKYTKVRFPANHYHLVVISHGGGAILGFSGDEIGKYKLMQPNSFGEALKNTNMMFDTVTLNSCLMGNFEMSSAIKDSAKYMIASQENAYIINYSEVLSKLKNGEYKSDREFADGILSSYTEQVSYYNEVYSVSLIDITKMEEVLTKFDDYFANMTGVMSEKTAEKIVNSRLSVESFGNSFFNMIDMISFIENLQGDITMKTELLNSIRKSIIRVNVGDLSGGSNGLSICLPYWSKDWYYNNTKYYTDVFTSENYGEFVKRLMSSFKHSKEKNLTEIVQSENELTNFKVSTDSFSKLQKIIAFTGIRCEDGNIELRSSVEIPFDKTSSMKEQEFTYKPEWPLLNGKPISILFTDSVKERVEYKTPVYVDNIPAELIVVSNSSVETPIYNVAYAEISGGQAIMNIDKSRIIKPGVVILDENLDYIDFKINVEDEFSSNLPWMVFDKNADIEGEVVVWFGSYDYAQNVYNSEVFSLTPVEDVNVYEETQLNE